MRTRYRNAKGLSIVEALIALCLIGIITSVVVAKYQRVTKAAQETALKTALVNIRTSITLFRMLNNRPPDSLNELVEKKVMFPARIGARKDTGPLFLKESYLMQQATDSEGKIIDSFGKPFLYDPRKGEVKATTKGYENW